MSIDFKITKKIISINIDTKYKSSNINIFIHLYNKIYIIIENKCWSCFIVPTNSDNFDYNSSSKFFNIMRYSGCEIVKKNESKYINFMTIPSIIYNTIYAFFIYNKYYTIYNNYKYYNMLDTIYTYKLFNCRDLYNIVA